MISGLATYISDSSNIGYVGILTFINMLNALQFHAQIQCPILTELSETVILLLDFRIIMLLEF